MRCVNINLGFEVRESTKQRKKVTNCNEKGLH